MGFNTSGIENKTGIGLKNILSSITYLKGTIEYNSTPCGGTVVALHILL